MPGRGREMIAKRERLGDGGKEFGKGRLGSWVRFLRFWLSTLYSPHRWLPETSVGSIDEIPLHAEEATAA